RSEIVTSPSLTRSIRAPEAPPTIRLRPPRRPSCRPPGAGAPSRRAASGKGSMSDETVPEARPASDEPVAVVRPEQGEGGPAPTGGGEDGVVVRKRRRRG